MTKKLANKKPKACIIINSKKAQSTTNAQQMMERQAENRIAYTDSARGILNMTSTYVPRQRQPNEAMPRVINMMQQETYKPPVWAAPIR